MDLDELTPEELELLSQIKNRKKILVAAHRRRKSAANNNPVMPRGRDVERNINTSELRVGFSLAHPCMLAPCAQQIDFSGLQFSKQTILASSHGGVTLRLGHGMVCTQHLTCTAPG